MHRIDHKLILLACGVALFSMILMSIVVSLVSAATVPVAVALLSGATTLSLLVLWRNQKRASDELRLQLDRQWAQIDAMFAVQSAIRGGPILPASRGWAASPDLLRIVCDDVWRNRPRLVVELGSGLSTLVIGLQLKSLGRGRLVSIEHDPAYAARVREAVRVAGLAELVEVRDCPLVPCTVAGSEWRWYQIPVFDRRSIDLLLVDGPPAATGPLARYPALPMLEPFLANGARLYLDDSIRPDEKEILRRWGSESQSLVFESCMAEKGCERIVFSPADVVSD
jgi:hypothetical protein